MAKILFLCTGNYYRSRFCEIYFNFLANQSSVDWRADSRGLALHPGNHGPLSRYTRERLDQMGIAFDDYLRLPAAATTSDFQTSDRIVAVKRAEHEPLITRDFPAWLERTEFWDVHDLDCATPEEAFPELIQRVDSLFSQLVE